MSHNNVWEWLLEQGAFQLLPKSRICTRRTLTDDSNEVWVASVSVSVSVMAATEKLWFRRSLHSSSSLPTAKISTKASLSKPRPRHHYVPQIGLGIETLLSSLWSGQEVISAADWRLVTCVPLIIRDQLDRLFYCT